MTDALEDHQGTVSIGGRTILLPTYLFADYIGGRKRGGTSLPGDRLDKTSAAFGVEITVVQRRPN